MATYLHKYISNNDVFYRESDNPARPGGSINLTVKEWQGRAAGDKVKTALERIHSAFKEEKIPEGEPEEPKEKKKKDEEKEAGILSLADHIRRLAAPVMEAPAKETEDKKEEPAGRWLHMFHDDSTGQVIAAISPKKKMTIKEIPATLSSGERGAKVVGGMATIVKNKLSGIAEKMGIDVDALKQMWHGMDKQTGTHVLILSATSPKTERMRGKEIGKPTFLKPVDLARIMKVEEKTAAGAVRDLASLIEGE